LNTVVSATPSAVIRTQQNELDPELAVIATVELAEPNRWQHAREPVVVKNPLLPATLSIRTVNWRQQRN